MNTLEQQLETEATRAEELQARLNEIHAVALSAQSFLERSPDGLFARRTLQAIHRLAAPDDL